MIRIGSKYDENRKRLISLIKEGEVTLLKDIPGEAVCYFCGDRIHKKINLLVDIEKDPLNRIPEELFYSETRYPIHDFCYKNIRENSL